MEIINWIQIFVSGSKNDSARDPSFFENESTDGSSVTAYFGDYMMWSLSYKMEFGTNDREVNDNNDDLLDEELLMVENDLTEVEQFFSKKSSTSKVKRSLELVEEQPPEGTHRPQSDDDDEARTVRSLPDIPSSMPSMPPMPSIPSMPSMPSPPTMPSMPSMPPSQIPTMPSVPSIPQPPTMSPVDPLTKNTEPTNDLTTKTPDVELLDTTTEDYGNVGEPNCEYDAFTYILKCGLNLITSIFGLLDSCCKPIFS